MKFDYVFSSEANYSQVTQDVDSKATFYTLRDGKIYQAHSDIVLGDWSNPVLLDESLLVNDNSITAFDVSHIPGVATAYVWNDGQSHRIAVIPDDGPLYGPNSMYRQYHALDSQRTYMNIEDSWQMIATLNHDEMNGVGTLSHAEIEERLNNIGVGPSTIQREEFEAYKEEMTGVIAALVNLIQGGK